MANGPDTAKLGDDGGSTPAPPVRFSTRRLARWLWYLVIAWIAVAFVRGPIVDAFRNLSETPFTADELIQLFEVLVGLGVVGILLVLIGRFAARVVQRDVGPDEDLPTSRTVAASTPAKTPDPKTVRWYPDPLTQWVGLWLAGLSVLLVVAMFQVLSPSEPVAGMFPGIVCASEENCQQVHYLVLTMIAAGIGSMITTILGYLEWSAEKAAFEERYVPWYFGRPLIGVLLGAVFFFVLKGGLIATVGDVEAADLNKYGLAGIGAFVGLFSKNAVVKLRELFDVLFQGPPDDDG